MAKQPLHEDVALLAAAIETTPGTAETLDATDATIIVTNPRIRVMTEMEMRKMMGSDGFYASVRGLRIAEGSFDFELSASATTMLWAQKFLASSGLGETNTPAYVKDIKLPTITGSTRKTLTIGLYTDGVYEQIHGAAGTGTIRHDSGKVVRGSMRFMGIYTAPTDVTILAPTVIDPAQLRFEDSDIAIGSWNPTVGVLELDLGGDLKPRLDSAAAVGNSGIAYFYVAERNTTIKINPERSLVADKNVMADFEAGTQAAMSWKIRNAGYTGTWALTKAEIVAVEYGAVDKRAIHQLTVRDSNQDLSFTLAAVA